MKRIICVLLATAMLLSAATACGKDQSPTNGTSVTIDESAPAEQSEIDSLNALYEEGKGIYDQIMSKLEGLDGIDEYKNELTALVSDWKAVVDEAVRNGTNGEINKALKYSNEKLMTLQVDLKNLS